MDRTAARHRCQQQRGGHDHPVCHRVIVAVIEVNGPPRQMFAYREE
jgi:hypothetical protein